MAAALVLTPRALSATGRVVMFVPRLHSLLRFAIFAVGFSTAVGAAEFQFVRVWPAYRDAASFERIGEYFGRPENTSGGIVLRTQPASRDGYYFLVRVKAASVPKTAARFELSVIRPDTPEPKTFSFPAVMNTRQTVFELGLTGADWPGGNDAHPVAWRLTLRGLDDRVLIEHKSFLWEKPAN